MTPGILIILLLINVACGLIFPFLWIRAGKWQREKGLHRTAIFSFSIAALPLLILAITRFSILAMVFGVLFLYFVPINIVAAAIIAAVTFFLSSRNRQGGANGNAA